MPSQTDLRGERVGLMTMDPGRTTGVTVSTITLTGSTKEIFQRDPIFYDEVNCWNQEVPEFFCEIEGSVAIAELYLEAQYKWLTEYQVPVERQFFVSEDFVLNRQPKSWERSGLSPVAVRFSVMGLLAKYPIQWVVQTPSEAMQMDNNRLRALGLWNKGDSKYPHALDAKRHAAQWVRYVMRTGSGTR